MIGADAVFASIFNLYRRIAGLALDASPQVDARLPRVS
jgi:hypothetical protein